jgi:gliding motility-associated-like protein
VLVKTSAFDTTVTLKGKLAWCEGYGDSTVLTVQPANRIQWFRNNAAIPGAIQPEYKVTKTGAYYAILYDKDGCSIASSKQDVLIDKAKTGTIYPVKYAVVDYPLPLEARQFGTTATWSPATHLNNPASYTPVFNSSTDQFYNIVIKTSSGCVTVDGQLVKIVPFVNIYVPTAFTPNNDGLNDLLRPILLGIKKLHYFRVFNRWGQLVFETKDELTGWNGTLKGLLQATQVLVWVAEGTGIDDKVYTRKGSTTLIR